MNDNSPKPSFCKSAWTCPEQKQRNSLLKMKERTHGTRGNFSCSTGEQSQPPTFALATEIHCAIDLSCRACDACGAMAMGAGLGFPVGDSAPLRFHPQPPTFVWGIKPDFCTKTLTHKTKLKVDKEVGGGN